MTTHERDHEPRARHRRGRTAAEWFDVSLPFLLTAAGLLASDPKLWFGCLAFAWLAIVGPLMLGATATYLLSKRWGRRIQGERRKPPPIRAEALETARAAWVAATLAAWPLFLWRLGQPTAMVWSLADRDLDLTQVILQTLLGVVVMDAWLYWKHRLLHSRALFVFHKAHHAFRDPTPFAGFAVGPVESLLTFWPILILCIPPAVHWAPLYFGLVLAFVNLNWYLHCGVELRVIEATLPRIGLNTSAFHNIHHSHANVNFGEAMTVWDRICRTSLDDAQASEPRAAA